MRWIVTGSALGALAIFGLPAQGALAATQPPGYRLVFKSFPAPAGSFTTQGSAPCPTGTVTWGGGVRIYSGSSPLTIGSSYWNGGTPGGWVGTVGTHSANTNFEVIATCANKPRGYKLVTKTVDDPAGMTASSTIKCAVGSVLLSGGLASTSDLASVYQLTAAPTSNRGYRGVQVNTSSLDAPFHLYALCAAKPAGYIRVSKTISAEAGLGFDLQTTCPTGSAIIGGGFSVSPASAQVTVSASSPLPMPTMPTVWDTIGLNGSAAAVTLTSVAICAA